MGNGKKEQMYVNVRRPRPHPVLLNCTELIDNKEQHRRLPLEKNSFCVQGDKFNLLKADNLSTLRNMSIAVTKHSSRNHQRYRQPISFTFYR